jgi:putative ABC transport system permease protein
MNAFDLLRLAFGALDAHRLRYGLSALAIGVGVAAVVLMVSIGEGTRRFVVDQVASFGTTLVSVSPGKVGTSGMPGIGGSARHLTIADARALSRLNGVAGAVAYTYGSALVEGGDRRRRVLVQGATSQMPQVWHFTVAQGVFLPDQDWDRGAPVAVLGPKLAHELFQGASPLGQRVRIANRMFRVIGVMAPKGTMLGLDMDDTAYLPVATALQMFDRPEVTEVHLLARSLDEVSSVADRARALMIDRHGEEDVTVVSQKDAMKMASNIMAVLTGVVTAIAGISLLVGAIGILTILWIVVQERVGEIGLLRALGATQATILTWFLCEAALTSLAGGIAGLLVGLGSAALLTRFVPGLEAHTPPIIVAAAIAMALVVGLIAGVGPAARAARMDPVEALRAE